MEPKSKWLAGVFVSDGRLGPPPTDEAPSIEETPAPVVVSSLVVSMALSSPSPSGSSSSRSKLSSPRFCYVKIG